MVGIAGVRAPVVCDDISLCCVMSQPWIQPVCELMMMMLSGHCCQHFLHLFPVSV